MNTTTGRTPEKIPGLDPRALFARAQTPERAEGRATWQPPAVEELALLLPAFVVEAFIGRGGMGAVYRVRQPALDRVVALELLPCTAENVRQASPDSSASTPPNSTATARESCWRWNN